MFILIRNDTILLVSKVKQYTSSNDSIYQCHLYKNSKLPDFIRSVSNWNTLRLMSKLYRLIISLHIWLEVHLQERNL